MQEGRFVLKSPFKPQGDQPQAIEALAQGVQSGMPCQVLLGVTGSGKTYTMASVIERVQRPTLVIAHNKTLAAQLCAEFREFFPDSAVEYFVSYYDYYQPEAYIASTDTYIEKDSAVNEEIERLRHSATAALRERRDVIVVASVSCIYSMGDPSEYEGMMISLRPGMAMARDELIRQLVDIQYDRSDIEFERGTFRVRGDVVEIFPAGYDKSALRVEFFGDEIDRISAVDVVSGHTLMVLEHISIYPATHYATPREAIDRAIGNIEHDLDVRIREFKEKEDTSQLLFVVEQYIGKPLTPTEMKTILFFTDKLHFSEDLIDYLIQYCVEKGKKDFRYIEKVAVSWAEEGITSPKQAARAARKYDKTVYDIMKALGKSSNPTKAEADYVIKWTKVFSFTQDIILEACERTVMATDKHRFEYADSILNNWHKNEVHHKADILKLDDAYSQSRQTSAKSVRNTTASFNQMMRSTYDFDALEKEIISN